MARAFSSRLSVIHVVLLLACGQWASQSTRCYERYPYNSTGRLRCPENCPVVSKCTPISTVRCVHANDCNTIHIGGVEVNGSCQSCSLIGCSTCESATRCARCKDDFNLSLDGTCLWADHSTWLFILSLIGLVSLWVCVDFAVMHRRPITNRDALERALRHHSRTKVRDESKANHPMYKLSAPMHSQPICGPAMPLFLNWFCLVMVVGLWLLILSLIFAPEASTFDSLDGVCAVLSPERNSVNSSKTLFDISPELADEYSDDLSMWASLSYVGAALFSIVFLIFQRNLWNKLAGGDAARPLLHRYALEAHGFPCDATDHEEVTSYWSEVMTALGVDSNAGVVEISIAYKFEEEAEEVFCLIDEHLRQQDNLHSVESGPDSMLHALTTCAKKAATPKQSKEPSQHQTQSEPTPNAGTFWVQAISYVMLGTDYNLCGLKAKGWSSIMQKREEEDEVEWENGREALLRGLQCSGSMIVVFASQATKRDLIPSGAKTAPISVKFRGSSSITVQKLYEEPVGILWQNYAIPTRTHIFRTCRGALILIVVLVAWALLYWPWAKFTEDSIGSISYLAMVSDLVVSMSIPIGNTIVAFTVAGLVENYGFRFSGHQQKAYLLVIVPCLFINVVCDLFVVFRNTLLSLNQEWADSPSFAAFFGMRLIIGDVFALLFPGYSMIPYIGEPLATVLLPFFVGMWRIKQDSRISSAYAEKLMMGGEIDLVNPAYGDIVVTSSTFFFTFLAPSREHWKIFGAYFVFGGFLYIQQRYRILRWQSSTYFGTIDLHQTVSYLWALPLGILAASMGAHSDILPGWPGVAGWLAFCIHVILHCLFCRFAITWNPHESFEETYAEAFAKRGKFASYRNTNPIEVLKSQYLRSEEDNPKRTEPQSSPLVFYMPGKDHLQPEASKDETYEGDDALVKVGDILKRDFVAPAEQTATGLKRQVSAEMSPIAEQLASKAASIAGRNQSPAVANNANTTATPVQDSSDPMQNVVQDE